MLKSFETLIEDTQDEKPSILLANGFSQAWNKDIFNYKNLLNKANFGVRDQEIKNIFTKLETFDFEKIMRALEASEIICKSYNVDPSKIDLISTDKEQLKSSLIKAISSTHPNRSSEVSSQEYGMAKSFLLKFKKIFTLNYDLLLYWVINKNEIAPLGYHQKSDGFQSTSWINRKEQNVFFIHGGLHLYDDGTTISKHTFNDDSNISITEKVQNNLNLGKFPLFVSEPTSAKKLERIKHNPYLNDCYNKISQLDGTLFIHGHSIDENDKHIFDKINNSNVKKVFISIFGDEKSDENRRTKANAKSFIDDKYIEFYDASTTSIWK